MRPGKDITLIVSGTIVFEAIRTADMLEEAGVSTEVINMHTLKPIDKKLICDRAKNRKAFITLEEHNVLGGLGSAVAEIISELHGTHATLFRFGVPDKWTHLYGSQQYLRHQMGFSAEKIVEKILLNRNELGLSKE